MTFDRICEDVVVGRWPDTDQGPVPVLTPGPLGPRTGRSGVGWGRPESPDEHGSVDHRLTSNGTWESHADGSRLRRPLGVSWRTILTGLYVSHLVIPSLCLLRTLCVRPLPATDKGSCRPKTPSGPGAITRVMVPREVAPTSSPVTVRLPRPRGGVPVGSCCPATSETDPVTRRPLGRTGTSRSPTPFWVTELVLPSLHTCLGVISPTPHPTRRGEQVLQCLTGTHPSGNLED